MSKKSLAISLLTVLLATSAFAAPREGRREKGRDGGSLDRIVKIIKRLLPVVSLGPDITVPNPNPNP